MRMANAYNVFPATFTPRTAAKTNRSVHSSFPEVSVPALRKTRGRKEKKGEGMSRQQKGERAWEFRLQRQYRRTAPYLRAGLPTFLV